MNEVDEETQYNSLNVLLRLMFFFFKKNNIKACKNNFDDILLSHGVFVNIPSVSCGLNRTLNGTPNK